MAWDIIDTKSGKRLITVHTQYAADEANKVKGLKAVPVEVAA